MPAARLEPRYLSALRTSIEERRQRLHRAVDKAQGNLQDPAVIEASRLLDEVIVRAYGRVPAVEGRRLPPTQK